MSRLLTSRNIAYLLLLLNAALWGAAPPIIKNSLNFISPTAFLFFRFLFASLLFTPIFLTTPDRKSQNTNQFVLLLLALLGTPLTLYPLFLGLNLTGSFEGSLIESSSPLFTIIGGLIFLREIMKPKEWVGLGVAVLGTTLLIAEPLFNGNHATLTSFTGNLLIVLSNIIWAAFLLLSKKIKANAIHLTYYSFLVSVPAFLLLAKLEGTLSLPKSGALPGILYMVIFGSIIAFWAYQEGQKRIEASEAAIFTYLKPVFTLPLSLFWLKEAISPLTIISALIILSGVYISEKR